MLFSFFLNEVVLHFCIVDVSYVFNSGRSLVVLLPPDKLVQNL